MAIRLPKPILGLWPFNDFPQCIELNGATFLRSSWEFPYPGVIAQYREYVESNSYHLFVCTGGMFVINHVDEYNPDFGHWLKHLAIDVIF